jgi:hypothetical protein
MGLKVFQIVFDNPAETYYPGQTVSGRVVLSLGSSKTIRGGYVGYIHVTFNHNNVSNFALHESGMCNYCESAIALVVHLPNLVCCMNLVACVRMIRFY